ncbi:MAG TPA: dienelactone hydrolase family protein [Myxococcota bacterium]|jgi:carboxymethylenebutenolidase
MQVISEFVDVKGAAGSIRCLTCKPKGVARAPAVVAWSDIFQLTPAHTRMVQRLAGHGFLVVAPELYARFEPAGTVLDFDKDRARAIADSDRVVVSELDADVQAVVDYVEHRPDVDHARIGAVGWCFGGHVAFRAALLPEIKAAACCYGTGIHNGKLGACDGAATSAGSLERAKELKGELLLVWGRNDPHIPAEGRAKIHRALDDAGIRYEARLYDAEHTFMRDEGNRWDPDAADRAFGAVVGLFKRSL